MCHWNMNKMADGEADEQTVIEEGERVKMQR